MFKKKKETYRVKAPAFRLQWIYCSNCGREYEGAPRTLTCSEKCAADLQWKWTLYIVGKEYYPRP